jgi:hypothetical protein
MNEEFISSNIKNDDHSLSEEESDYTNLITKLEEIKTTISLLEKTIIK